MQVQSGGLFKMEEGTRTFLQVLLIAGIGGGISYLHHHRRGCFRALEFTLAIIISAFAGMEGHFIASWLEFDLELQFAVAGIAGYGGGALLDVLVSCASKLICSKSGVEEEKKSQ